MVWGWCVAGIAFLPYALYVLAAAPLARAVGVLLLCLLGTLGPLVLADRHFYGAWTVRARGGGLGRPDWMADGCWAVP